MSSRKRVPKYWFFLLVPYIWDVLLIPFVNKVEFHPFGIPFLLIWMLLGVIVVCVCIGIVYSLDLKNQSAVKRVRETNQVKTLKT